MYTYLVKMPTQQIPGRVFLDTSTLQMLQDWGEFIYDGGVISEQDKIWSLPGGIENLDALRKIVHVGRRGSLQLALSRNSLQEVIARGKIDFLEWALEMIDYWDSQISAYGRDEDAFSGAGKGTAKKLAGGSRFGYLSKKDAVLIQDALRLECDVFLTMERRLPKNAGHIERELGIKVLQPVDYWSLLAPWAALLA